MTRHGKHSRARKSGAGGRARKRKRFLPGLRGWKRRAVFAISGLVAAFVLLFGLLYAFARIPEPNDISTAQSAIVFDQHGKVIGRIHSDADRVSIKLKDMPLDLQHAVVATEDRTFYTNPGISVGGIVRAAIADVFGGHQGGSTITQQYVKNAFVGSQRSIIRKAKEAIIALKLDHQRSKDQILEDYLNTIYFGRGAYGVEAAASAYFGKHARALSLPESALLAGLIRAPGVYDPAQNPEGATKRRDVVLGLMVRDRYIDRAAADRAKRARLPAARHFASSGGSAPHYLDDVRTFLEKQLGARTLYTGGVKIFATLDRAMQQAAEDAVHTVYDLKSDPEAALVSIDPHTGAVRAMVGARNYATRQLNIAMHAFRQPGSAFKPATLATYVDEGKSIKDRYKAPAKITLHPPNAEPYTLSNYDHKSHGILDVEHATWLSVNTVYAQMIMKADPAEVVHEANRLGITSKLAPVPSLALGTSEVSPLELTAMYSTFAARGIYHEPYLVEKVVDARGRVLFQAEHKSEHVLGTNVADTVNHVLQGVIRDGTGRSAQIGRPAAGKTGTTEDYRDAWFAGYTPELATVVWNGYAGKSKFMTDVRGIRVVGGSFPAQMWRLFMEKALQDLPTTSFATPKLTSPSPTASSSPSPSPTNTPSPSPTPSLSPSPSPSPTPKPSKSISPSPSPSPNASSSP